MIKWLIYRQIYPLEYSDSLSIGDWTIVIIYKGMMSQSHSLGLNALYMGYCSDIVAIIPIK